MGANEQVGRLGKVENPQIAPGLGVAGGYVGLVHFQGVFIFLQGW